MILRITLFAMTVIFAMTVMFASPLQAMASRELWRHQNTKTFENGCDFSYLQSWQYNGVHIKGLTFYLHISICNNDHTLTHVTEESTNLHYYPNSRGFDRDDVPQEIRELLLNAWQDYNTVECHAPRCHDDL